MKRYISNPGKLLSKLKLPICVNLHVTDWVAAQWEDSILRTVIKWISNRKVQDLKHLFGDDTNTEEGMVIFDIGKS